MAYEFQFIMDSRFKGTKKKLITMDKRLKKALTKFQDVRLSSGRVRTIKFSRVKVGSSYEPTSTSWRITYRVSKKGRIHT